MLAKISLGLQKFRNHSENFAILVKFSLCENFGRLAKFRYLAKFSVPRENTQFCYLTKISLASEIHYSKRNFSISLSLVNFARLAKFW